MLMGALNDWREVRLEDVCERITVGHVGSMANEYVSEGVPFLRSQNITPFKVDLRDVKYITSEFNEKLKKSALKPGDVAVVRTGYPGTAAVIPRALMVSNCSDLVIIRPGEEIDSWFLSCLFNSVWGKSMVAGNLVGVAQQHFNVGAAKNLRIRLPPIQIQQTIASILRNYDDLIENNTRRIEILEEMARRLYEEWFVQFRFPGHEGVGFKESELGLIPEGWKVSALDEFGEIITGKTPSKNKSEFFGGDFPFIKLPDMHGNTFIIETTEKLSQEGVGSQKTKTIPPGSICVSCIGTAGVVVITSEPSQTNQQINSIVPRAPELREFLFFAATSLKGKINSYGATGATMTNLSRGKFSSLQLVEPKEDLLCGYSKLVAPFFDKILCLQKTNRNLRAQRDLLLPRLISGEIDVSDVPMPT
ncbi:restriction endonuclease subunit S [Pseudomonas sp. LAM2023]|uniref:restriction endonuclease subunit S n=1 Tax=Pseudomonas sp. LAM2023 TaxID=2800477 RepID=UPI001909BBEF|nr:restriction endonuclease subunit S [Pseudomonas sp. LAM2023]